MNLTKTKGKIEGSDRQLKAQLYQKYKINKTDSVVLTMEQWGENSFLKDFLIETDNPNFKGKAPGFKLINKYMGNNLIKGSDLISEISKLNEFLWEAIKRNDLQ
jgi:hypothetical protein